MTVTQEVLEDCKRAYKNLQTCFFEYSLATSIGSSHEFDTSRELFHRFMGEFQKEIGMEESKLKIARVTSY